MKFLRPLTVVAAAAFGSACEAPDTLSTPVVTDSAGVRVVMNPAIAPASWTTELLVAVGEDRTSAGHQLYRVEDATRLSTGGLVILNGGTDDVRFFDSSGVHLRTVGRNGYGPGEFQYPRSLFRNSGDTLRIWDNNLGRITVLDPAGGIVETVPIDRSTLGTTARRFGIPHDAEMLPDGTFVMRLYPREGDLELGGDAGRSSWGMVWITADGSDGALLGWFPGSEQVNTGEPERPEWLVLPAARRVSHTAGGDPVRFFTGDQVTYEIRRYVSDGSVDLIVRKRWEPTPVPDDFVRRWEEEVRAFYGMRLDDAAVSRMLAETPRPPSVPAFRDLIAADGGDVWARHFRPDPAAQERYDVFGADGGLKATVTFETEFVPLEIGPDYVLGRAQDADDVESVKMYRLHRR